MVEPDGKMRKLRHMLGGNSREFVPAVAHRVKLGTPLNVPDDRAHALAKHHSVVAGTAARVLDGIIVRVDPVSASAEIRWRYANGILFRLLYYEGWQGQCRLRC